MTKDKERDDAMIAEAAEMFPPDTVDVQSRYVIVHQLRASADIQDAQTKRETGWADTSDRACLMRKAADALDALLAKLQPAPKPCMAERLARGAISNYLAYDRPEGMREAIRFMKFAIDELRAEWEAERPAVVVPSEDQIKQMVTRFLCWKLPDDFHPDDGISFEPFFNIEWNAKQGKPPQRRTPTGTNLFNYTQAEAMVRYIIDGAKGDE
jgi:hypothetical protein